MSGYTQEEWINKAKDKHGDEYDYSKVNYITSQQKVTIICKIHGEFQQLPAEHLRPKGCMECAKQKRKLSIKEFIDKSNIVHNYKYDYSNAEYTNNKSKIKIICPNHGEFIQTAEAHLNGSNCPKCVLNKVTKTTDQFIKDAIKVHGNRYDYSKVDYKNNCTNIEIICLTHGSFLMTPANHLSRGNCKYCNYDNYRDTKEDFVDKANKIHYNTYDYSKVIYNNNKTKVIITCKKHGDFEMTPNDHLCGGGCSKCILKSQTKLYNKLSNSFKNSIINFEERDLEWLKPQRFDIYFPEYNIAVEYNGEQHYVPKHNFGGEIGFQKTIERDNSKKDKCVVNNCTLFEVKYDYNDNDYEELVKNIETIIKKQKE